MEVYVGCDWAAKECVCAVATRSEEPQPLRGRLLPSVEDVRRMLDRARNAVGADETDTVRVVIEAGAPGWAHLLHAADAVVHVVDAKQARRFAESMSSSGAKDDRRDAVSLANLCRSEQHRPAAWKPDSSEIQALLTFAANHEVLTKDHGRSRQRIREQLRRTMPLVEDALPSDLDTKWVVCLLRAAPTPWHAKTLTRAAFDNITHRATKARREKVWDALQRADAPWIDEQVASSFATVLVQYLDQLELLEHQLAELDKAVDRVSQSMPTRAVASSMGGIGLWMSTALILFVFRDGVPADRDEAAIRMGASPVFVGSGRTRDGRNKGTVRMRKSAPSRARCASYLIGRLAARQLNWAKAMYADARKRNQSAATAYRRIARCVLRIQTAMARKGAPYDNDRYVLALKAQGVPWAAAL